MIRLISYSVGRQPASEIADEVEAYDIAQWAEAPGGGGLPVESAQPFGRWLETVWGDFADDDRASVKDVLDGALTQWCGGRTL